jgi:hypothetical protein
MEARRNMVRTRVLVSVLVLLCLTASSAEPGHRKHSKRGSFLVALSDSATRLPIRHAQVSAWCIGQGEPDTTDMRRYSQTDTAGHAWINGLTPGLYGVGVCSEDHGRAGVEVRVVAGQVDTVSFAMRDIGRPRDGRVCEIYIWVDDPSVSKRRLNRSYKP